MKKPQIANPAAEPQGVEIIEVPNTLKEKLHAPGGKRASDMIGEGQKIIQSVAADYPAEARREVLQMRRAMKTMRDDIAQTGRATQTLLKHGHNIKGQAGTFGFMLLTMVADSLVKMIERLGWHDLTLTTEKSYAEIVDLHLGAMDLILASNLTGDGGQSGKTLLDGLHKATAKRLACLPDLDEERMKRHTMKREE